LDLVGQEIGPYRILSLLGRGGTAEVYKAFHPALKREVALKVLLQEVNHDVDWVRRFLQERELLASLDHPHILPIYDAGEYEGRPYLVMKYMVDTTTLRTQLDGHPWPVNRVVKVVTQVAEALDAAHRAGVVHRDIKPSNILVTSDLRCSVFDFGIAKPVRRGRDTTTGSDLIVGTPEFMSPEQCKGERIDHRSDVYSLAVMTYQMLAGHVPFTAETAVGILMKHLTEPLPIPPRGVALPPAVNGVLRTGMARDPKERFGTAGAFAGSLREAADQKATVTLHAAEIRNAATPTRKIPQWVKKLGTKKIRLALGAGGLLAMLLLMHALWPSSEVSTQPPAPDAIVGQVSAAPGAGDAASGREAETASAAPSSRDGGAGERRVELAYATLEIDSTARARVTIDGRPAGTAPGVVRSLLPGRHVITLVTLDGEENERGLVQERSIDVTPGSTHRVRFDFEDSALDRASSSPRPTWSPGSSLADVEPDDSAVPLEIPIKEWTGFLTDEDCGVTGGQQGSLHLRCAERCIRGGKQPRFYSRGKLYRLEGLERLDLVRGEPLRFRGWLEEDTVHVVQ
jgi:tRNA A-37 threonylcarbamoyl transferase component Bud32